MEQKDNQTSEQTGKKIPICHSLYAWDTKVAVGVANVPLISQLHANLFLNKKDPSETSCRTWSKEHYFTSSQKP